MHAFRLFRAFLFLIVFALLSCEKENQEIQQPTEGIGDTLDEADNAFLESASVANPALNQIIGSNGKLLSLRTVGKSPVRKIAAPQGVTNTTTLEGDLVDAMLADAQALSGQKILSFAGSDDLDSPTHMGLVYSFGQRDLMHRLKPAAGNARHRRGAVFGTDCSGMMINLLRHAGVDIANCDVASFKNTLAKALASDHKYRYLSVIDQGHLSKIDLKSGDFIVWPGHIGMIADLGASGKIIFQSNGTGTPADAAAQLKNLGPKRGVHPLSFETIYVKGYWGDGYTILRLENRQVLLVPAQAQGAVGREVAFEADYAQLPVNGSFAWSFGDNATVNSTDPTVEHTYAAHGTYAVTVVVKDGQGKELGRATASATIGTCSPSTDAAVQLLTGKAGKTWRVTSFSINAAADCQGSTRGNPSVSFAPDGRVTVNNFGTFETNAGNCIYQATTGTEKGTFCLLPKYLSIVLDDGSAVEGAITSLTATKLTVVLPLYSSSSSTSNGESVKISLASP